MIIAIIGASIVMVTSILLGVYYGSLETFRYNDLSEMKKALTVLKSEIEFTGTPLPEAVLSIAEDTKKPVDKIFLTLYHLLESNDSASIFELWSEALETAKEGSFFSLEDIKQLTSFGRSLGIMDKSTQIRNIELTTDFLDNCLESLNKTRYKNQKMFQGLGALGGILIILIFI